MTSRPQYTHKRRPLSAIFLGPITNTPPDLPDLPGLPEPPSPGAHSSGSGLPSPPATNSTGSGSTGDNSTHGGSLRRRAASDANATPEMLSKYDRSFGSGSTVSSPEDEGGFDDEDTTAKMAHGRRRQVSAENAIALQRVRSLTERNRMALDKLSRLNTPSPSTMSRSSRSPLPALTGPGPGSSDSGRSSSRLSHHTHSHSAPTGRDRENTRSGSETERESQQPSSSYYSSDDQSETPPSSVSHAHSGGGRYRSRRRGSSLPDSPETRRPRDRSRGSSPGPSQRTPRKRSAIKSPSDRGRDYGQDTTRDVTTAALAAVASMRQRSPSTSGGKRSRQPLPKEFRESKRNSLDGRPPSQPTTPHRDRHYVTSRNTPSPKASSANSFYHNQVSPRPQRTRFSTVRELTRRHQTRWVSEDLTNVMSSAHEEEDDESYMERPMSSGGRSRQQLQRGGSGSMDHSVGTRLVGGSLRAAGIGMRHANDEDVFRAEEEAAAAAHGHRRPRSNGTPSVRSSEWDEGQSMSSAAGQSRTSGSSRAFDGLYDLRTPANPTSRYREERGAYTGPNLSRPATSMADYHHAGDMPPPRTAPQALRTYKSTYALERDREGIGSEANSGASGSRDAGPSRQAAYPLPPLQAPNLQERTYGSPRVRTNRLNGKQKVLSAADEAAIEHLKIMDESLVVFETLLSRLPPMGNTTTSIIPELFRDAQSIVRYSEQVNGMLRAGTNRALERQIEREIVDESDVIDMVQLWRDVGNDFRDCMRVSDELVRTMTGFLIGVGKVLRDSGSTTAGLQHHLRAASMDEDAARRLAGDGRSATGSGTGSGPGSDKRTGPGSDKRSSTDGGRSAETRRSWDLVRLSERERDRDRDRETLRRSSSRMDAILSGNRPSSSLLKERDNQPTGRRIDLDADGPLPAPAAVPASVSRNGLSSLTASSSTRRLYTPRDREEYTPSSLAKIGLATIESQESMHYEPSPTPAPRVQPQSSADRRALALAPLSIPAPLPALPSEYQLSRRVSAGTGPRKISTASNVTVRANTGISVTTPSTTTAVTPHTVSNNITPEKASFPQTRGEPSSSTLSRKPTVTFSRPSTISMNALNGLAQRDTTRRRTNSQSSSEVAVHDEPISATSAPPGILNTPVARTPRSGSDTERPSLTTIGRRTLGPRGRVSLDESREDGVWRSGDRSGTSSQAQTMVLPPSRKERRRTITEIFS